MSEYSQSDLSVTIAGNAGLESERETKTETETELGTETETEMVLPPRSQRHLKPVWDVPKYFRRSLVGLIILMVAGFNGWGIYHYYQSEGTEAMIAPPPAERTGPSREKALAPAAAAPAVAPPAPAPKAAAPAVAPPAPAPKAAAPDPPAPPAPAPEATAPDPPAPVKAVWHVVEPGETMYRISLRYFGSGAYIERIASYNGIADIRDIKSGMRLRIPPK